MFSENLPCLLRQHGSCSTAQRPEKLSEKILQNLFHSLTPQTVYDVHKIEFPPHQSAKFTVSQQIFWPECVVWRSHWSRRCRQKSPVGSCPSAWSLCRGRRTCCCGIKGHVTLGDITCHILRVVLIPQNQESWIAILSACSRKDELIIRNNSFG